MRSPGDQPPRFFLVQVLGQLASHGCDRTRHVHPTEHDRKVAHVRFVFLLEVKMQERFGDSTGSELGPRPMYFALHHLQQSLKKFSLIHGSQCDREFRAGKARRTPPHSSYEQSPHRAQGLSPAPTPDRRAPMSLGAEIKKAMFAAMKAKNDVEKEIFRVALGEIDTAASRSDSDQLSDSEVQSILKKLIKSNREAHDATSNEATRAKLLLENAALDRFLPKALSVAEIVQLLTPVAEQIKAAQNQG